MISFSLYLMIAYLLGSIPFGLMVAKKVKGINLREHGSRNVGATNVFRVVGKGWGIAVFLFDAFKGFLAVAWLALAQAEAPFPLLLMAGVAAILGHAFPVWLSFRGGKGVATALGVFLALATYPAVFTFALWIAVFWITRIISFASLVAAFSFPFVIILTSRSHPGFGWLLPISILLSFFIFYTHRTNLLRLIRGDEKKLF